MRHEFIPYAIAFREPLMTASGRWTDRHGAWLRVDDDDGLSGLGEVAPLEPRATPETLLAATAQGPCREAAFELAALDLEAQRAGKPIAEILGEFSRDRVAVNALVFATGVEEAAHEAGSVVAQGFRTVKLKVASLPPERDIARILAVRKRIGPNAAIRIDANGAWDEATALRVLKAVEHCGIEYVEDPVAGDLSAIRSKGGIPVAADVRTLEEGRAVVNSRGVDFLVLKPMALGGLRATRALACAAIDAGIGVVITSVFDTAVGVAGALHLAASLPGPARAHGLATVALLEEAPVEGLEHPTMGELRVPGGPGLGVYLREIAP